MQHLKYVCCLAALLALNACNTTVKFPVSNIVPAAEITATKKKDKNDNYTVSVTAKNLASPDRLNPPRNNYSLWIVTDNNGVKNAGQFQNKNSKTVTLETTTPFNVQEVFITAEQEGNLSYPTGQEISRVRFKK